MKELVAETRLAVEKAEKIEEKMTKDDE